MKKLLTTIGIMLLTFGFFYLLGAFSQTGFDISQWSNEARIITAMLGGMGSFFAGLINLIER